MSTAPKFGQLLFISTLAVPTPVPVLTTGDINHVVYEATAVERPVAGVVGVALPALHAEKRSTTTFPVGLVGSGTAGTAPVIGPLLRACATAQVITPTISVEYSAVNLMESAITDAVNIHINESGEEQTTANNRGSFTLNFPAAGIPTVEFAMTGDYAQPTTVEFPDPPDFAGQSLYKLVDQNTKLTLITEDNEIDICFENFTFTQGAETQIFALGGCPQNISHTNMMATWSATAIRPAIADMNLWEILENRETFDLLLKHGIFTGPSANPGFRVTLELTGVTLDELTKAQIKDKAARTMSGAVLLNDFVLRFD